MIRAGRPSSLAQRFALASAALAVAAVLLVSLASWWVIRLEHDAAERRLANREREFHAANVGSNLTAVASRMAEVASSTILATGLVDSAGKETYLAPFLNGIRQINGIPVQVLFSDFSGQEIASNAGAHFNAQQMEWLRSRLLQAQPASAIFPVEGSHDLVAMAPLSYARTTTPEGAVLYKLSLEDIKLASGLRLEWAAHASGEVAVEVAVPEVFRPLGLRVAGHSTTAPASGGGAPQYLLIMAVGALVFSAVFVAGHLLARRLTRDLSELEVFASRVVSAGGSQLRAPPGQSREVSSLAVSVNSMLERLYQQHERLRSEGEKLGAAAEALKAADRRKDEFLAMLAHELRNPLAPISTGAELLRLQAGENTQVRRTSELIARQVRHMTRIVDDLLDVSRVTRGLIALHRAPVDLNAVALAAVDQIQPVADSREHQIEVSPWSRALTVVGDQARLVQVASNLLQNACKYTPNGGRIRIAVFEEQGEACLSVTDNGSGIAPEFLPHMFGLFTQSTRMPDRSQGGLGLGLPLVKHLTEAHGGSVSGQSEGPGLGSVFTVRLPLASGVAVAQGHDDASSPGPAGSSLRVLVVDDNLDAAETLAALLSLDGHDVEVAFAAKPALDVAARWRPDVFILDIGLPEIDGFELARRLRRSSEARGAMLVALTGYGQQADRDRSSRAGFDHHLVKPVDPIALKALLAKTMRPALGAEMNGPLVAP
jgi:signal transduction histidine kinase/ActR/RegA family two-component response regulator